MKVKEEFFSRASYNIGNGMDTRFWEDTWLGNKSLAEQYPLLYNILKCKQVSVANVLNQNPLNISFRAYFKRNCWRLWLQLVQRLMSVQVNDEKDIFFITGKWAEVY
jgi:hypothetical protein